MIKANSMKHTILVATLLFCLVCNNSEAQQTQKNALDEKTVVKDTSGMQYPYAIWQKLMATREYTLKRINPGNASEGYFIIRLTEQEKARRDSLAPKPMESRFFTTGSEISSFKEKDMEGNKWNLKNLKGKVVVLNFWFVNCPPCKAEMPELNKVVEKYKADSSIVFLSLCLDDKSSIEDLMKTNPFQYKIIDNARYICDLYRVTSYPTHVVLDKEGKVQYHTSGLSAGTVPWLKKTIDLLLKKEG
jgi:thiol-disulfide isomerase/thioredoxin